MTTDLNPSQRRTLALLRVHGHLSRAELAGHLGFSRPALTEITRVLEEQGYIEEHGVGGNARGQPKVNLRIRAKAACVVGAFIQKDCIQLLVIDLRGEPLGGDTITPTPENPEAACDAIAERAQALLRRLNMPRKRLLALGVATTGFFVGAGDLIWPPAEMAPWREFPLQRALAGRLDVPVVVENDGNAAALAEHMKGAARGVQHALFIYLAYGIGGGLIDRGGIFRGAYGNACEIGRLIPPHPAVRPSLTSLAYQLNRPVASIRPEEISAWFAAGDPRLMAFLKEAVKALRAPLASALVLFDPATIVIGGKFPQEVLQWFVDHLDVTNSDTANIPKLPKPTICRSALDQAEAGLWGAALLPLHQFMSP